MHYGYRKKTAILGLRASPLSVPEKINALSDLEDKHICQAAYDYLTSSLSSFYTQYNEMRGEFIYEHKEPSFFAMYSSQGIECALWPHFYPFTAWCESIHDGRTSWKSRKISFITKCLSSIVIHSLHFDLLQTQPKDKKPFPFEVPRYGTACLLRLNWHPPFTNSKNIWVGRFLG